MTHPALAPAIGAVGSIVGGLIGRPRPRDPVRDFKRMVPHQLKYELASQTQSGQLAHDQYMSFRPDQFAMELGHQNRSQRQDIRNQNDLSLEYNPQHFAQSNQAALDLNQGQIDQTLAAQPAMNQHRLDYEASSMDQSIEADVERQRRLYPGTTPWERLGVPASQPHGSVPGVQGGGDRPQGGPTAAAQIQAGLQSSAMQSQTQLSAAALQAHTAERVAGINANAGIRQAIIQAVTSNAGDRLDASTRVSLGELQRETLLDINPSAKAQEAHLAAAEEHFRSAATLNQIKGDTEKSTQRLNEVRENLMQAQILLTHREWEQLPEDQRIRAIGAIGTLLSGHAAITDALGRKKANLFSAQAAQAFAKAAYDVGILPYQKALRMAQEAQSRSEAEFTAGAKSYQTRSQGHLNDGLVDLVRQDVDKSLAGTEELRTRSDLNLAQEEETLDRISYRQWKLITDVISNLTGAATRLLGNFVN